ncbi:hypothetical protein [Spirosoma sp. KUDC1026]|uniref:hypothetical protein n=1 Tax=Spirosoma sp. KUDC1026 TaxID=2745947 RepID=UPI00159BA66C|nr:hypothetical protein [Spirosoma sp. KUDC1026]QKZ14923.1 hypothetical protein HU175_20750 [Spirosoma sp. KUDC1026]
MLSNKDYSQMTLNELVSEEKKMNSQKTPFALFIGGLVGVAVWSTTHQGGFIMTILLLISAVLSGNVYSRNLKSVQAEISRRDSVG